MTQGKQASHLAGGFGLERGENMKTPSVSQKAITREWFVVDATDAVLGRLSSRVASILRGKNKAIFTTHLDTGDFVVVLNADKVKLSGKKETDKLYWRYTGYPGGERAVTVDEQRVKHPERIVAHAIKGMLPKGPLGRKMYKKLKVYSGSEHPHVAQQPKTISW
jgi:large subunit ribosomal protein L13